MDSARCSRCGAAIWWGYTSNEKRTPVDLHQHEAGNVVVDVDEITLRKLSCLLEGDPSPPKTPLPVRVLKRSEQPDDSVPRWRPHFATCRR